MSINAAGAITGFYIGEDFAQHGFVRSSQGDFTIFDPPGAVRTIPQSINAAGAITGNYIDGSNVSHGFLRDPHP